MTARKHLFDLKWILTDSPNAELQKYVGFSPFKKIGKNWKSVSKNTWRKGKFI